MLSASHITVRFKRRDGTVFKALDDVSLTVPDHGAVGLVGESGSGKSTLARVLCGLVRPDEGEVSLPKTGGLQLIFQDAAGALNPRQRIADALAEVLSVHRLCAHADIPAEVARLLQSVGIPPELAGRYPHELSGGQCQRVCVARALALRPSVLIGDEPVSALDVSVQARILRLLSDLREKTGLSLLLITHDLSVVSAVCDSVYVLEHGRLVESGPAAQVFSAPSHPYTRRLLAAIPRVPRPTPP